MNLAQQPVVMLDNEAYLIRTPLSYDEVLFQEEFISTRRMDNPAFQLYNVPLPTVRKMHEKYREWEITNRQRFSIIDKATNETIAAFCLCRKNEEFPIGNLLKDEELVKDPFLPKLVKTAVRVEESLVKNHTDYFQD